MMILQTECLTYILNGWANMTTFVEVITKDRERLVQHIPRPVSCNNLL